MATPRGHGCNPRWQRVLDYCPTVELAPITNAADVCTGAVVSTCASYATNVPGRFHWEEVNCGGGSRDHQDFSLIPGWSWYVSGVEVDPSGGEGMCAVFTTKVAGVGRIIFTYSGTNQYFPECDETLTVEQGLVARKMELTITKEYLGISMVNPIGEPQDFLEAYGGLSPDDPSLEYEWKLEGASVFSPMPDGCTTRTIIKEIGNPSASYKGEVLTLSKKCETPVRTFTVVKVDVDLGNDESTEEDPGRYLPVNDNDSDGSGAPDCGESPLLSDDPDLVPVKIKVYPAGLPGDQIINLSGVHSCYEDRAKRVKAKSYYTISELPPELYLEGAGPGQGSIGATHGLSRAEDMAVYTVLKCDLLADSNNDGSIDQYADDPIEMDKPGLVVGVNNNDDNTNRVFDIDDDTDAVRGEKDLREVRLSFEPDVPGGRIRLSATAGGACVELWTDREKGGPGNRIRLPKTWSLDNPSDPMPTEVYVEGIAAGEVVLELEYAVNGSAVYKDAMKVTVLHPRLIPDWNRDRKIDAQDENRVTFENPFRFWINDDSDDDDISSGDNDLPGQELFVYGCGNHEGCSVDGRSDLLDLFPLWLDIGEVVSALPPDEGFEYMLVQEHEALSFGYTDLSRQQASDFLILESKDYGVSRDRHAHNNWMEKIRALGTVLDKDFLNRIGDNRDKGILMIEGAAATTEPLVLYVWNQRRLVLSAILPISIDGVERMFRWINLRHVTGGVEARRTDTHEPRNYPDKVSNGKHFVFVHGYNVPEQGARGAGSEVFKRLFQSGSRAMFTTILWHGDETPGFLPPVAYYHADVINALQTAPILASAVNGLSGQKYIAAHSLGNMVVSSAIVDHGLAVERYFMIDAAVAMEAYSASECHRDEMAPLEWFAYSNRLWSSEWHTLFMPPDGRTGLTWRGRFGNIPHAINYYSSGEDVLNNNGSRAGAPAPGVEKAWVLHEMLKGGDLLKPLIGVQSHGGWGYNTAYQIYNNMPPVPQFVNALSDDQIKSNAVFKPFYRSELYQDGGGPVASIPEVRTKLLAEALPALSRATGRNAVMGRFDGNNFDLMEFETGWPRSLGRWLHGDFKDVAYPYLHMFYERLVKEGGLK